jgi:hypothetical protein
VSRAVTMTLKWWPAFGSLLRGSTFGLQAPRMRSACRFLNQPMNRNNNLGFRLASTLPPTPCPLYPLPPQGRKTKDGQ